MFPHDHTGHHLQNGLVLLAPVVTWLAQFPIILSVVTGMLSATYYALLIYDRLKNKGKK